MLRTFSTCGYGEKALDGRQGCPSTREEDALREYGPEVGRDGVEGTGRKEEDLREEGGDGGKEGGREGEREAGQKETSQRPNSEDEIMRGGRGGEERA